MRERARGGVIGWVLRWIILWCGVAVFAIAMFDHAGRLHPNPPATSQPAAGVADRGEPAPAVNTLVYPADRRGHVLIDAVVNGAPMRLLVDTGASLVALTPADARAAGIDLDTLSFAGRSDTANGVARMAPVMLREIRIGQLSIEDVPAAVLENLPISLLGMSFLGRLQSYEMRGGKLTITW